ncbi:hypothetical protein [Anaerosolibacter sp.]|uniref:hypothetical protein n=1 Tax=Anaerosolibacter sp. TaxID=1872527 RepID=UPI0039F0C1B7
MDGQENTLKPGFQKEVDVNGKKYLLQKIPFYSYVQMTDRNKNRHGVLMQAPYIKELVESCVVKPKVAISDFDDDFEAADKLVTEIETFLRGRNG